MKILNHLLEENVAVKVSTKEQVDILYSLINPGQDTPFPWYKYLPDATIHLKNKRYGSLENAKRNGYIIYKFSNAVTTPLLRRKV